MQTTRKIDKGREVDDREAWPEGEHALRTSNMVKGCSLSHWCQRGRYVLLTGRACSEEGLWCCHQWQRGRLLIKLSLMPTVPGHWCQQWVLERLWVLASKETFWLCPSPSLKPLEALGHCQKPCRVFKFLSGSKMFSGLLCAIKSLLP